MKLQNQHIKTGIFIFFVVLAAIYLVGWRDISPQTAIPSYATAQAIESRYATQIDLLRELAKSFRINIDHLSNLSFKEIQKYLQDCETKQRRNKYFFSLPEILSAKTHHQLTPEKGEGALIKEHDFRETQFERRSSPSIDNAAISIGKAKSRDGSVLEVVKYKALMIHPTGHKVTYEMILDLQELKKIDRSNGKETGTHSLKAKLPDSYVIRGSVLDQKGNPVQVSVMWAEKIDTHNRGGLMDSIHPRADSDENGRFEIKYLKPSTYDLVFQKELNIGNENTLTMDLESRTITVKNGDVDLGEVVVPLENTIKRYRELGLLSPPEKIEDNRIYYFIISDHQAPTEVENMMQSEYQSIYVVDSEAYSKGRQERHKAAKRVSGIGMRDAPVWNISGDKIAYLDRSSGWNKQKIVLRNVSTGEEDILKNAKPSYGGISWDESGSRIAYKNSNDEVCIYDLSSASEMFVCSSQAEHLTLSPDSKTICFMTRDLEDRNDADGWRLNFVNIDTGKKTKVGRIDDNFGLIGPFFWAPDSSSVIFSGFILDAAKHREYAKYEYILETGTIRKYTGDFQDVYDQRVRYWIRTIPPLCP
jgi:hypothetical protein